MGWGGERITVLSAPDVVQDDASRELPNFEDDRVLHLVQDEETIAELHQWSFRLMNPMKLLPNYGKSGGLMLIQPYWSI